MHAPEPTSSAAAPILVVDDEESVVTTVQHTLWRAQYETVGAGDPMLALEELKRRQFSVMIADQLMPGMTGLELLAQVRQTQPYATRILITGVVNLDTVMEAINKGEIFRFIVKPWLREELLATVKNGVQRYELICQNARLQAATQAMNEQLLELNRSLEQHVKLVAQKNQEFAEVNSTLEQNLVRSLELCLHTAQTFYPSLGNQARRVSQLCKSMGQVLPLPPKSGGCWKAARCCTTSGWWGCRASSSAAGRTTRSSGPGGKRAHRAASDPGPGIVRLRQPGAGGPVIRAHHERFDGRAIRTSWSGKKSRGWRGCWPWRWPTPRKLTATTPWRKSK